MPFWNDLVQTTASAAGVLLVKTKQVTAAAAGVARAFVLSASLAMPATAPETPPAAGPVVASSDVVPWFQSGVIFGNDVGPWFQSGVIFGSDVIPWFQSGVIFGNDVGPWFQSGVIFGNDVGPWFQSGRIVGGLFLTEPHLVPRIGFSLPSRPAAYFPASAYPLMGTYITSPPRSGFGTAINMPLTSFSFSSMGAEWEYAANECTDSEGMEADAFVAELYRNIEAGDENSAIRLVYNRFYRARMSCDLRLCDRILADVDEKRLTPTLLVAILTVTAPVKNLNERASFYQRAEEEIARLRGAEACKRILIGL